MIVEEVAYSKTDVKNLMFNLLEPKLQKVLEAVLRHDLALFMKYLKVARGDPLEKSVVESFEWMVMDSELLRAEFLQGRVKKGAEQVEALCKGVLGYDMIASEIVRMASVFELNEKFKDGEA